MCRLGCGNIELSRILVDCVQSPAVRSEAVRESRRALEAEEGRFITLLHLCNAWQRLRDRPDHARKFSGSWSPAKVVISALEDRRG